MFTIILLSLAAAGAEPITIIEDSPRIVIPLARYDLRRADDLRHLKQRIVTASKTLCEQGDRGISYLETVACVKTSVADGNAQLGRVLAQNPSAAPLAAAIAVTAPAK